VSSGPHVRAALLCERVLEETDRVPSLIRVIDRFLVSGLAASMSGNLYTITSPLIIAPPQYVVSFFLFLAFASGDFVGRKSLRIALFSEATPDAPQLEGGVQEVAFIKDGGVNIIQGVTLPLATLGRYWFDVTLDGVHVARVPFRVDAVTPELTAALPGTATP